MNLDMDRHIHETAAVCDYVQGLKRSTKRLWLSFDEWNVWYRARGRDATDGRRTEAPKLLEEVYNLEDALLVGGLDQHAAPQLGSRACGLPRAAGERDCAARDQRQTACSSKARISRMPGRSATRGAACSISESSRRPIRSERPDCRPTSLATGTSRLSTSLPRTTRTEWSGVRPDAQSRSRG